MGNVEVSINRTHIIFATNILENLKKITEKEEERREIVKKLSAVQLRNDVKKQKKTQAGGIKTGNFIQTSNLP